MPSPLTQYALIALGHWLQERNYQFVTVTPCTHARVNARPFSAVARSLRDIFGWSRPYSVESAESAELIPTDLHDMLLAAGLVRPCHGLFTSVVRFSSLGRLLIAHSAYPTGAEDAVFFGPDTYRFCSLIEAELARLPLQERRILDVGCGAGPGGLVAARATHKNASTSPATTTRLVLADINERALEFAAANAALAGMEQAEIQCGNLYAGLDGLFDLIVANPPYLVDPSERAYRHGGGALGTELGERIVAEGLPLLAPGGRLVLYTGVPIVEGADSFLPRVKIHFDSPAFAHSYRELDPDVFGEELEQPAYRSADRIAAVALVIQRLA